MRRTGLMRGAGWMEWRRTLMPDEMLMCRWAVTWSQMLLPSRMRRVLVGCWSLVRCGILVR